MALPSELLSNGQKTWLIDVLSSKFGKRECVRCKPIFVASQHEFSPKAYHANCDNRRNLLTVVKCGN